MSALRPRRLLTALAVAGTLTGCLQGIGDRCQLDSDCSGYTGMPGSPVACVLNGNTKVAGGTCQMVGGTTGTSDLSVVATPDMAVATDGGSVDMAQAADGATDGGLGG